MNKKRTTTTALISDKTDSETKTVTRKKGHLLIMIRVKSIKMIIIKMYVYAYINNNRTQST